MRRFLFLYAGMTVFAAWLAARSDLPSLFSLGVSPERLVASLGMAAALALAVVQGGKALEHLPWYRRMAAFLKRMLTAPDLLGPRLDSQKALVIAIYSSVGEEALFRGFAQPWLIRAIGEWTGPGLLATVLGVVGASLVFGLLHFPVVEELRPWTVFAVFAGLVFGGLAAWSGSLAAPVLAHLLINWLNLKRLAELPIGEGPPLEGSGPPPPAGPPSPS